jgi:hypothetical protein
MSYKNTLSSRTHKYIRHIISAHCALSILLYYCVQSSTLTDMHARVLFYTTAAQTLTCIINIAIILFEPLNTQSFASRSSISSPYRQATQDLQPLLGTLSRYTQLFKDSFNVRPTSHQRHLCVKNRNLTHTTSPSLPTFSQPPEYLTVNSSKPPQSVSYLQINVVLQSDSHPACG